MAQEYQAISGGINTYTNPLSNDGVLIHAVNVVDDPYGAIAKRPGYNSFLGTSDGSIVNSLLAFPRQDGTSLFLYRASGTELKYSVQGTGPWTGAAGDGTLSSGAHFGAAVLNDIFIGGDGTLATRHTTDGTTFTDTTQAPVSPFFANYGQRIFASGTAGTVVYSSSGSATNWSPSAPADSSSFLVPTEGKPAQLFATTDRLFISKNRGAMFEWDNSNLVDMATRYGPSSPYSVAEIEDYRFWINQYGHFGFDGANTQLLSNPIQRYFYNRRNSGISPSLFSTVPATCHIYDYFAAVGTITDDFTQRTINNAIINYNYQKNEYLVWSFADNPTAFLSYFDENNKRQLIFGSASGQCFQLDLTAMTDNGAAIESEVVYCFTYAAQSEAYSQTSASSMSGASYEKKWNWLRLFFNPGCEVQIQGAFANTFTYQHLSWFDIVDNSPNPNQNAGDGIVEFRFPQNERSRLFFLRIFESSNNSLWRLYKIQIDADIQPIK